MPFQTPGAVSAVCPACRSMVVRKDAELQAIGTVADLPPDHSPLQIGSRGSIAGSGFTILGRLRLAWEDGGWNEWHILFSDQTSGWLGEAQGLFYLLRHRPLPPSLPSSGPPALRSKIRTADTTFVVQDIKRVELVSAEGELPEPLTPKEFWQSVDAASGQRRIANLEIRGKERNWYEGHIYHPEEISWENLRPVPGWRGEPVPVEKNRTDSIRCVSCGGTVTHRAAGLTSTLACSHCGTILDLEKGTQATVAQKVERSRKARPFTLAPGLRGTLEGEEWEVIGALRRKDPWSEWEEFLLYNPWQGFLWLTCFQGHWNLVRRCLDLDAGRSGTRKTLRSLNYHLFSKETATVTGVAGEFYWKVRVGETAKVADFIAPPYILSSESYPGLQEITWSEGQYLPASTLKQAFKVSLRSPDGIFLNQPNPWHPRKAGLGWLTILLLVVVWGLHLGLTSDPRQVEGFPLQHQYQRSASTLPSAPSSEPAAPLVSPSFELSGGSRPLQISLQAPVSNSWFGLDALLINEKTGETRIADLEVSFYHGYDNGHWQEGSTTQTITLPSVPPGRYHLQWKPQADAALNDISYSVKIASGGGFFSNPILATLAILAWPLLTFIQSSRFESKRWAQSDFSPQ